MKASYPKPKPHRRGPKRRSHEILQQAFLERAMDPVMQMKKRMVSMGYSIAMI